VQILARGDSNKAFIRHGQSEAMTEVTLSSGNPARPVVIRRLLKKDNSSEWKINGGGSLPCGACMPRGNLFNRPAVRSPTQGDETRVGVLQARPRP
jgi:hypothetical protein